MGSVYEEITRLETAKTDIETAIEACGVNVPDTKLISDYASYIRQIPSAVFSELNVDLVGGEDLYIKSIKLENGLISATPGGLVSSTSSGLAPKIGTSTSATISSLANEWVLTSTKGGTPTWRKLPSNAFNNNNTTYSLSGALSDNTYVTTLTDSASGKTTATVPAMSGSSSTAAGTAGLVPAPAANKHTAFLRGDGTWVVPTNTTYSVFTGATSSTDGTSGLVPKPTSGNQGKFLKADGTWATPTNTTYSVVSSSANGLAPKVISTNTATVGNAYFVLASTNGSASPSWYKLPTNAFKNDNTTYTFASGNGGFTVTPSGGTAQTVSIGNVDWGNITGKPSSFTPSSHTHTYIEAKDNYTFTSSTLPNSFDLGVSAGFVNADAGYGSYGSVLTVRTYIAGGGTLLLYAPYSNTYGGSRLKARFGNFASDSGNSWTTLKEIAWTSDIPTVTDYYWANIKVSSSSNEETTPKFSTITTTGTSYVATIRPRATNQHYLGSVDNRWLGIFSNAGNFSGRITSSVAVGTAPFKITSTTLNENLNADMLDGKHAEDFAAASHLHSYLPLSGGTISNTSYGPLTIERKDSANMAAIKFKNSNGDLGSIGMNAVNGNLIIYNAATSASRTILDSGNSSVSGGGGNTWGSSITVKINGTTKTLTIPSNPNTWRSITDSYSGTDSTISLSQKGGNALYNALVNGYASSAGNAETVDNYHIWTGTKAEYNSATKNNSTIYIIHS